MTVTVFVFNVTWFTVFFRELHNKDTGVDLSVPNYRELPGLMRSSYEYQIVVVSNLSCFKMPSHKDSDVVQFTVSACFTHGYRISDHCSIPFLLFQNVQPQRR